jgi:hypothetical protein
MARVRDVPTTQIATWRTEDGQTWKESVIHDGAYGDPRGFVVGDHYVVTATQTNSGLDRTIRHVWVSRDAERWEYVDASRGFAKIIGWNGVLWGFRAGEVWRLDISRIGD